MPKNTFAQNQTQAQMLTQTLSPHQVMVVRLLELTNIELEDKVRSELMENPALEAVDSDVSPSATVMTGDDDYGVMPANSADDYRSEDDVPDYNGLERLPRRFLYRPIYLLARRFLSSLPNCRLMNSNVL